MMARKGIYALILFFIVCINCLRAQKSCTLVIKRVDTATQPALPEIRNIFPSKPACMAYVKQLAGLLAAEGYISASVDSVYQDSTVVYVNLFIGEKYVWNDIHVSEKDWLLLNQLGFSQNGFHNKPFNQQKVTQVYENVLEYFADNGYPFAKVGLDSIAISGGSITAHLAINKGLLYHIDTLTINGTAKLSQEFFYRYLDIKPHDIYNQAKLDKITSLLAKLPYVEQYQPWGITMLNTGSRVNLYLRPRKSNQINALIGFLPANPDLGGRLLLTGDASLNLRNPFGAGETIGVTWQQLQAGSPRLDLQFARPYMFNSPFGLNCSFDLYKQDSSWLNINAQAGVQYSISANQSGMVYIQEKSTSVLNIDTAEIILTKQLPDVIDLSTITLGVQYNFNNTNYPFNPHSGNELQLSMAFGNKKIKKNNTIVNIQDTTFNYASLYDTLKLNSYIFISRLYAAHYFALGRQSVLKAAVTAGWYQTPDYFENELFQIGGYKLLRGFDEESIYTNRFVVGTAEYRYLLGQNSYMFGFVDWGWAKYQTIDYNMNNVYTGVGLGLAFETKGGIINFSFAAGSEDGGSFDLNQLKVHLGFLSVF